MGPAKETAEEQLLKMIEGPRGAGGAVKRPAVPAPRRWLVVLQELSGRWWRGLLPGRREADVFLWNLRLAQRVLWVGLAGLGAYVILDLLLWPSTPSRDHRAVAAKVGQTSSAPATPPSARPLKPLAEYVSAVTQRNPFTGAAALSRMAVRTAKSHLEELAQNLVVVGIDRGANPVALIEQKNPQRTYMVKVGEALNGLTIKQISSEGVVVGYEGEELVLP